MRSEGSLAHWQKPATCRYSEPDQSSQYPIIHNPPSLFLKIHFRVIFLSTPWSSKWNSKGKIEVKLSLCMPWRPGGGEEVQLHPFLTSALDGGWVASFTFRSLYYRAKQWTEGSMDPGSCLGVMDRRKSLDLQPSGTEICLPAHSLVTISTALCRFFCM